MGIKKKIILGFILIGILLLMSGILSSIELAKLNSATAERIKENEKAMTLSKSLIDALHMKNDALLNSLKDTTIDVYDSVMHFSDAEFDKTMLMLKNRPDSTGHILRIEAANRRYDDALRAARKDYIWLVNDYSPAYSRVTATVREYMLAEQDNFQDYAATLEANFYRALMVGIIALASGTILLAAFYFMINAFFLSPVLKMERALREFLKANIPYGVKVETEDEIRSLSDSISEVCAKTGKGGGLMS